MTDERVRILIIDDDEAFMGDLAGLMSGRHHVTMARSVKEARSAFEKFAFDAVLLDVDLGRGLDGFEILEAFHASDPNLPIIMVTRDASAETAMAAVKKGAVDYIDKRPDLGDLERRISRAIEERGIRRLNAVLREEIAEMRGEMVGDGAAMQALRREIAFAAADASPVLIVGETGTGKELVAREIHKAFSPGRAFVPLNCAAGPRDTFGAKLFGSVPGGFTGAKDAPGVFELARDGVLFLDEITEIDPGLQGALLRAVQEREFERIGDSRRLPFRGKLLASTNRPLRESRESGILRDDLYYRFSAHVITVPPLRERREDIPALARHFLERKSVELKRPMREVDDATMTELCRRDWPGNVRELENAMVAFLLRGSVNDPNVADAAPGGVIADEGLFRMSYHEAKDAVLTDFQRRYTDAVIAACGGDVAEAARRMKVSRFGLQKMRAELEKKRNGS